MKPICLIDFDDVVASCNDNVIETINKEYGTEYPLDAITSWGPTGDEILDTRFKYYSNPDWVANQPIFDGAVEFINKLKKRCEIVFCTAVHPDCMSVRAKAIQDNFDIDSSHIIMTNMKELVRSDFQLDDSPVNIEKSISKNPVLFRRPWNYDISGVMSVSSYDEFITFVDYILGETKEKTRVPANAVICLVAPTGSGKTEIMEETIKAYPSCMRRIFAYTTSETPSYSYHSMTREEFLQAKENGYFAENTVYAGEYYGISKSAIDDIQKEVTEKFICGTDICGAMALKNLLGKRVIIVYVEKAKIQLITNIINKDFPDDKKAIRINSIDAEIKNKRFADFTISSAEQLIKLIK